MSDVPVDPASPLDSENCPQRDRAYALLHRMLVLQELPAGSRIREALWSTRLNVNRTAIREALARLEAEGLIEKGARAGYSVPRLTADDVFDILEVRIIMESGAIDRICREKLNTARHLQAALAACDDFEHLMAKGELEGVPGVDRRFHEALILAAGNNWLNRLYLRAPIPLIHPEVLARHSWVERTAAETLDEHRHIVAAILKRDSQGAQQVLRDHLLKRYVTLYKPQHGLPATASLRKADGPKDVKNFKLH